VFAFVDNEALSALDALTGEERWRFAAPGLFGTPVVREGVVYVSGGSGTMLELDAASGGERWQASVPGGWGAWAVDEETVYVASMHNETLTALDRTTGLARWQTEIREPWTTPVIVGDEIYLVSDDALRVYDAVTGAERWFFPIEGGRVSTPAVVGGIIYLSTDAGIVYAIGGSTG
jgi:outer membrane protein assembly factor BamB